MGHKGTRNDKQSSHFLLCTLMTLPCKLERQILFSELHTKVVLLSMSRTSHTLDYSLGKPLRYYFRQAVQHYYCSPAPAPVLALLLVGYESGCTSVGMRLPAHKAL